MKFVRTLEGFFEKYIEGFFNQKFSGNLQPIEIAQKLTKEMIRKRSVGVAHIYVPNHYRIDINSNDYEQLTCYASAVQDELAEYLKAEAEKKGFTLLGKPQVDFFHSEVLRAGEFSIQCDFTEPMDFESQDCVQADVPIDTQIQKVHKENPSSDTRTFTRLEEVKAVKVEPQPSMVMATLTVEKGIDKGLCVDVLLRRIHIGRRENNEMPLTDMNTSRLHAYIDFENGKHVLYDANSLNGTYVNNHRITQKVLESGDKINLGHTELCYEVN